MSYTRTSYRKVRKFTPGEVITLPSQLILAVKQGRWIWFGKPELGRAYHAGWICNYNFSCVMSYLERQQLRFAVRNRDYPYVFKAEFMQSRVPEVKSVWWATCGEIPSAKISEATKDAVVRECEKAAVEHTGQRNPRVQVLFETPAQIEEVTIPLRP